MRRSIRPVLGIVILLLALHPAPALAQENLPDLAPRPRASVPERWWVSFGIGTGAIGLADSAIGGGFAHTSFSYHGPPGLFSLRINIAAGPWGTTLRSARAIDVAALYGMSRSWESVSLTVAAGPAVSRVSQRIDEAVIELGGTAGLAVSVQLFVNDPELGLGIGLDLYSCLNPVMPHHGLCLTVQLGKL